MDWKLNTEMGNSTTQRNRQKIESVNLKAKLLKL